MHASLGPTIEDETDSLLRRIHQVEHQIAMLREARAHDGESGERARIAELAGRVLEAEKELLAVKAGRRRRETPMTTLQSLRIGLYAVSGVMTVGGLFTTWAAWHLGVEPLVVATVAVPGLVGAIMLFKTYTAKSIDDLDTDGI